MRIMNKKAKKSQFDDDIDCLIRNLLHSKAQIDEE